MTYRVWADPFDDDMTGTTLNQPATFPENVVLRGARAGFVFYNNPTLTALSLAIYSDRSGAPGGLLHRSSWRAKGDIITLENGVRETYFDFSDVNLQGGVTYHFAAQASGYAPTSSSYLAWLRAFPDPVYP